MPYPCLLLVRVMLFSQCHININMTREKKGKTPEQAKNLHWAQFSGAFSLWSSTHTFLNNEREVLLLTSNPFFFLF